MNESLNNNLKCHPVHPGGAAKLKAMIDAIHVLEKYYYNEPKTINLSAMLNCDT
ncbi:hypothetical protein [Desulfitobacterium metallireducens]|uniref:hypothetical protein n=1 Tax=Desulfitobacterium metallireducens TaxID=142877 RepID=UPI0002313E57|nr:hypothetical protein [Desulfitobacterium metallireducens]